jgi:hypothetical protein
MKTTFIALLSFAYGMAIAADYPAVPLESLMTKGAQEAIGVSSMTPSQREALRRTLIDNFAAGFEKGKEVGLKAIARARAGSPSVIESKIDGEFEGWQGETIVKLVNGQIWQQAEYRYEYHYAFMPDVLIYRSGGGYKMKVKGTDEAVGVLQLK